MVTRSNFSRSSISVFNPTKIKDLQLWLDASDLTTLRQNSDGTTPALNAGDQVGYWKDKSGNGRNATQATAAARPTISNTLLNQKTHLSFSQDGMIGTFATALSASQYTAFVVVTTNTSSFNNQRVFSTAASTGNDWASGRVIPCLNNAQVAASLSAYNGTTGANSSPVNGFAAYSIFTGILNSGTLVNSINGGFGQTVSATQTTTTTRYAVGETAHHDGTARFTGSIAEIIFFSRALSFAERKQIERYLGAKWGIALAPEVSNTDAQDWINRVYRNGGTVSSSTANAVDSFCNAIDSAGIRDKFYRLNLFCGTGLNACLVPLYRGASLAGTQYGNTIDNNTNFISGDYIEYGSSGGLTGARTSSKRLDTGLSPSTFSGHNFHVSSYECANSDTSYDSSVGAWNTSNSTGFYLGTADLTTNYDFSMVNNALRVTATPPNGHIVGVQTGNRTGAIYRNGSSVTTTYVGGANTSSDWSSVTWGIGIFSIQSAAGTFTSYSSARLGGYSVGVSMNSTQAAAFYTAMQNFQTTLGRNI